MSDHDDPSPIGATGARARALQSVGCALCVAWVLAAAPASALTLTAEEVQCGTFRQTGRLNPEDYRRGGNRLQLVEEFHFGPTTEALIRPMQKGGTFGADINYTLWGYPNHHRALISLVRLGARERTDQPKGSQFTIDCYFRRALRFVGDDLVVRMLYARYLGSVGRREPALAQLRYVVDNAGDSGITYFNAGLAYLDIGEHESAVEQARRAQALGHADTRLQLALERLGKWPAQPPEPGASAASRPETTVLQRPPSL